MKLNLASYVSNSAGLTCWLVVTITSLPTSFYTGGLTRTVTRRRSLMLSMVCCLLLANRLLVDLELGLPWLRAVAADPCRPPDMLGIEAFLLKILRRSLLLWKGWWMEPLEDWNLLTSLSSFRDFWMRW